MRFIWLIFVGLVLAMVGILPRLERRPAATPDAAPEAAAQSVAASGSARGRTPVAALLTSPRYAAGLAGGLDRRDSVVFFALQQLGTNYCYAGTTPETGFDCSGFVQYVFNRFGVPVPHSTALLIDVGRPVPRHQALPGDIVVFTGTDQTATTPGHAGIIVTAGPDGPLRFVHSSSARRESGVKISQVEGTDYERRFMQVRRVLGAGMPTATRPAAPARVAPPVPAPVPMPTPAPARVAAPPVVAAASEAVSAPKTRAARRKAAPAAKKKTVARKTAARKTTARKTAARKPRPAPRKTPVKAKPSTSKTKRTTR